jgi:hypothetical protein
MPSEDFQAARRQAASAAATANHTGESARLGPHLPALRGPGRQLELLADGRHPMHILHLSWSKTVTIVMSGIVHEQPAEMSPYYSNTGVIFPAAFVLLLR